MNVSAVMTVRDGERYVAAALGSVLGQTVPPAEVIVVDDGSTDGTRDVLRSFGTQVTVIVQPPGGIAKGLNRALRRVRHDAVAFLDADDLWEPDAIEVRLARLDEPAADAAGGATVQFVSPELDPAAAARFRYARGPVRGALLGALLFRRESIRRLGPFDETLMLAPAVDWIAQARMRGLHVVWVDDVVLRRRIHGANTSTRGRNDEAMLEVVRRQQRRRNEHRR